MFTENINIIFKERSSTTNLVFLFVVQSVLLVYHERFVPNGSMFLRTDDRDQEPQYTKSKINSSVHKLIKSKT